MKPSNVLKRQSRGDRIIVLRLGKRVATYNTHVSNAEQVVASITGAVFGEATSEKNAHKAQEN